MIDFNLDTEGEQFALPDNSMNEDTQSSVPSNVSGYTPPVQESPKQLQRKARAIGYNPDAETNVIPDDVDWNNMQNREDFLLEAKSMGVSLSQIKNAVQDKWKEPVESTIIKIAKKYEGDPKQVLKDFGMDETDMATLEKEMGRGMRYARGVRGVFWEAFDSILPESYTATAVSDTATGDTIYQELGKQDRYENIYQALEGVYDKDTGTVNTAFNIAGGVGEAMPYMATGIATSMAKAPVMAQLITDFAISEGIDVARYYSTEEMDTLGWNTAANVVGFGLGKYLAPNELGKLTKLETEVATLGDAKVAQILNGLDLAKKEGIDILSADLDPATRLAQVMATLEKSPITAGKLMDLTSKDVDKVVAYMNETMSQMVNATSDNVSTGRIIKEALLDQSKQYDQAIDTAYKNLETAQEAVGGSMSNPTTVRWLTNVLDDIQNGKVVEGVLDSKEIEPYVSALLDRYSKNGNELSITEMYRTMRDIIGEASTATDAKKGRAFAKLADRFSKQFDNMTGGDQALDEIGAAARKVYKDKLDLFGYNMTGKDSDLNGFIHKFMQTADTDIEAAAKSVNTMEKVQLLKRAVKDNVVKSIQRNQLQMAMQKGYEAGDRIDLLKVSKELSNKSDSFLRELYGDEGAKTIRGIESVARWIGERSNRLSKPNILSATQTIKNMSLLHPMSMVKSMGDILMGVIHGRTGITASKLELERMQKSLQKSLNGQSIDDIMKGLRGMGYVGEGKYTADELIKNVATDPEIKAQAVANKAAREAREEANRAMPTVKELRTESAQQLREIRANMKIKEIDEPLKQRLNELNAKLVKEPTPELVEQLKQLNDDILALKSKDPAADLVEAQKIAQQRAERLARSEVAKQQATQNTRVSKEINNMFKTRVPEADSRLLYNRIQENISTAANKGDEKAVSEALNDLNTFREYMADLPKRLDSAELKALKLKAAREEAERLNQQGIRDAAERNARIEAARARAEAQNTTDVMNTRARENVARNTDTAVDAVPTTRQARFERASNNVISNLNDSTGKTWRVSGGETHPRFTSSDGESFTLHIYGNSIGATTTGLTNGSGSGKAVYPAIWNMARDLGGVYTPDSTLLRANPVRMGLNMLLYADSLGGKDIPWIRIGRSQAGIQGRGLANQPLTKSNQKSLAQGLRNYAKAKLEDELPNGARLNTQTTPEELRKYGEILGANSNIRLGKESLTKIINWLYASKPGLTLGGGMMAIMLADDELMDVLDSLI